MGKLGSRSLEKGQKNLVLKFSTIFDGSFFRHQKKGDSSLFLYGISKTIDRIQKMNKIKVVEHTNGYQYDMFSAAVVRAELSQKNNKIISFFKKRSGQKNEKENNLSIFHVIHGLFELFQRNKNDHWHIIFTLQQN